MKLNRLIKPERIRCSLCLLFLPPWFGLSSRGAHAQTEQRVDLSAQKILILHSFAHTQPVDRIRTVISDLSPAGDGHHNVHGILLVTGLATPWHGMSPPLFQLRADYSARSDSFNSFGAASGTGYPLDAASASGSLRANRAQAGR